MRYLFILLLFGCNTIPITWDGNPKCYDIINTYEQYVTDSELEAITLHYVAVDYDPDAYGHILMDHEPLESLTGDVPFEFSVQVYKDKGGIYLYEWNPCNGWESKRYLTDWQKSHVIKL